MKRKPLVVGASLAAVLALGGLGTYIALTGDNSTTGGKTTTAAGISATPSTSPSAGGNDAAASPAPARTVGLGDDGKINWCEGVKESDFTGSAVETFGAKAVKDAYCLMLTFTLDESTWIGSLLTEPEGGYKPEMFSFVKPYMTPKLQKIWDEGVRKALNGSSQDAEAVQGLTFSNFRTGHYELFMNGMVLNKKGELKESYAWTSPDGGDRLVMTFDVSGDVVLRSTKDNKLYLVPTKKTITYTLAENGVKELPWVIDGVDPEWWIGGKDNIKPMPDTSPSPSAQ